MVFAVDGVLCRPVQGIRALQLHSNYKNDGRLTRLGALAAVVQLAPSPVTRTLVAGRGGCSGLLAQHRRAHDSERWACGVSVVSQ